MHMVNVHTIFVLTEIDQYGSFLNGWLDSELYCTVCWVPVFFCHVMRQKQIGVTNPIVALENAFIVKDQMKIWFIIHFSHAGINFVDDEKLHVVISSQDCISLFNKSDIKSTECQLLMWSFDVREMLRVRAPELIGVDGENWGRAFFVFIY